jgi:hypothetical protein
VWAQVYIGNTEVFCCGVPKPNSAFFYGNEMAFLKVFSLKEERRNEISPPQPNFLPGIFLCFKSRNSDLSFMLRVIS